MSKLVSNLCKIFLSIAWHQKPTVYSVLCVFPQLRRIVLKFKKNAGIEIRISKHKWKRKLCLNAIMQL